MKDWKIIQSLIQAAWKLLTWLFQKCTQKQKIVIYLFFIYLLLFISDLSTPPLFSNNINKILALVYIVHVNEKWDEKWKNNSVSDVNNTVLLQSRGVRQDRHKIMQLYS